MNVDVAEGCASEFEARGLVVVGTTETGELQSCLLLEIREDVRHKNILALQCFLGEWDNWKTPTWPGQTNTFLNRFTII